MAADFDPGTGLGPRLREVRITGELSVRELARRVGCSASLISQIERGVSVPSVGVLYSLATELGSSLDYLLFGSGAGPGTGVAPTAAPRPREISPQPIVPKFILSLIFVSFEFRVASESIVQSFDRPAR